MIPVPSGAQVWLAAGHTDMRKGFDGLALLVQETLRRNPHNGHLFVFRGRRGWDICWKGSIGVCRNTRGVQQLRDNRIFFLAHVFDSQANHFVIPS